jgi:drug/metabolite transporter (DMT)-like permease
MTVRTLEKLLVLVMVGYAVVFVFYNMAQNRQLLDLSVPVMAAVLFVLWLIFGNRQHQH